jgi:catechol 2,3-dioxygenase-like lactoylglutathione lyase family enzyme
VEPDGLVAHHVTLTVGDLGASSAWYQKALGLEVVAEREGAGWRRVLLKRSAGLMIGLTEHDATASDDTFHETRVGLDHVSFACAGLASLEAWRERFEGLGLSHSPIAETPVAHVLVFRDPDGIQLEFFAPKGT